MRDKIICGAIVALIGFVLVAYPFHTRRCVHCGQPTLYIPFESNVVHAAKESLLDRAVNYFEGIHTYHVPCLNEVLGDNTYGS
jgi:hypothetical protein